MAMPTTPAHEDGRRVSSSTDRALVAAAACMLAAALAGCAAGSKLNTIPQDGPTMEQIYRRHMNGAREPAMPAAPTPSGHPPADEAAPFRRYLDVSLQDIQARFARLPNPDLVMYVAPHLSPNGRYPIPGYSTVFSMYEHVEYAMPGEAPWRLMAAPPPRIAGPAIAPADGGASAPQRRPRPQTAKE